MQSFIKNCLKGCPECLKSAHETVILDAKFHCCWSSSFLTDQFIFRILTIFREMGNSNKLCAAFWPLPALSLCLCITILLTCRAPFLGPSTFGSQSHIQRNEFLSLFSMSPQFQRPLRCRGRHSRIVECRGPTDQHHYHM